MAATLHLNLDDAWPAEVGALTMVDACEWGPQLRFSAPPRVIERFDRATEPQWREFVLYGSGDFHHLTALWLRRIRQPVVVVSFDNHPDWDVRPPRWACGGWVNRALELPHVQKVSAWGCGGAECWWPGNLFANRGAQKAGKLEVHPWADGQPSRQQQRPGAILRADWRERFVAFAEQLRGAAVYITVDLDCLTASEAVTNWDSGKFTAADVAWAIGALRDHAQVVAGDMCGAFSSPRFARWKQRFASEWDHPKLPPVDVAQVRAVNLAAFETIWPVLIG